jgi:uncharacterized protein (TIGR00251 family)
MTPMPSGEKTVVCSVLVKPRAGRDEIVSWEGVNLVIRVKAPPREGEANESCRRLLARFFGVPASAVVLLRGSASRRKRVAIGGISSEDLEHIRKKWMREGTRSE